MEQKRHSGTGEGSIVVECVVLMVACAFMAITVIYGTSHLLLDLAQEAGGLLSVERQVD